MNVKQAYEAELVARGYQSDPAQLRAVDALERCANEWAAFKEQRSNAFKKLIHHPNTPRGVYMYGGVGRGKSFLMDCFYNAVPIKRKTRLHFHEFMREVHRELRDLAGKPDPAYSTRLIGLAMMIGVLAAAAVTPSKARDCVKEYCCAPWVHRPVK